MRGTDGVLSPAGRRWSLALLFAVAALLFSAAPGSAATFTNPAPIPVPATGTSGIANPYPSTIAVSGLTGAVTSVTATLTGMTHTFPGDLDVLLVGPSGQNVVLLADVGGSTDINNVTLTFDSSAPTGVPPVIVSGTYRPTAAGPFIGPAPAPPGPYGAAMTIFNGTVPNGTWSLFAYDDAGGDLGTIAGGWSLDITTNGPTISSFAPATGPAGTQVVITGTNLTGATAVTFGGIPASAFTVTSPTQITATVPPGAVSGPISVTTPNGIASSQTDFQISPPPAIASFTPTAGRVGTTVAINGTNLTGATAISFGGVPAATFSVTGPATATAVVPAGAGAGPISVTTPAGTGASTTPFVVQHPRTVTVNVQRRRVTGRVIATDAFTKCTEGVRVRVQRRINRRWRNVGTVTTTPAGRYSVSSRRRSVPYRAIVTRMTLSTGDVCLAATGRASG